MLKTAVNIRIFNVIVIRVLALRIILNSINDIDGPATRCISRTFDGRETIIIMSIVISLKIVRNNVIRRIDQKRIYSCLLPLTSILCERKRSKLLVDDKRFKCWLRTHHNNISQH